MPEVPVGALEEAAAAGARRLRPLAAEAAAGVRYVGQRVVAGARGLGRLAVTKPVKFAAGTVAVGAGSYAALTLGFAGAKNALDDIRAPAVAPAAGPLGIDTLAPGVPAGAYQQQAAADAAVVPTATEFLTSWKGLLVIGLVGAVVLVVLLRRK